MSKHEECLKAQGELEAAAREAQRLAAEFASNGDGPSGRDRRDAEGAIDAARKKAEMLRQKVEELRAEAVKEQTPIAHARFGKALKEFERKVREAAEAEAAMAALRDEIGAEFNAVGMGSLSNPISEWQPQMIYHLQDRRLKISIGDFIDKMKAIYKF